MGVVAGAWSWFLFQPAWGGNGHALWREAAPGSNTVSLGRHTSLGRSRGALAGGNAPVGLNPNLRSRAPSEEAAVNQLKGMRRNANSARSPLLFTHALLGSKPGRECSNKKESVSTNSKRAGPRSARAGACDYARRRNAIMNDAAAASAAIVRT